MDETQDTVGAYMRNALKLLQRGTPSAVLDSDKGRSRVSPEVENMILKSLALLSWALDSATPIDRADYLRTARDVLSVAYRVDNLKVPHCSYCGEEKELTDTIHNRPVCGSCMTSYEHGGDVAEEIEAALQPTE